MSVIDVELEIDTQLGTKSITDTLANNVENYQYAQVTDSNIVAGNIRKDINVLGITGTYEGELNLTGQSEGWPDRPPDVPNLDLIDLTDFYGMYTTINIKAFKKLGVASLDSQTGYDIRVSHSIYRGHLGSDGQFVSDETLYSNVTGRKTITLLNTWPDYVIIKHDVGQGFKMYGGADYGYYNYDVEVIGKSTKSAGRIEAGGISTGAARVKLINFNNSYVYSNIAVGAINCNELVDFDWSSSSTLQQLNEFGISNGITHYFFRNQTLNTLVGRGLSFTNQKGLKLVDFTGSSFPSLTSLEDTFRGCDSLEEIKNLDAIFANAENITSTYLLFYGCSSLKQIIVHNKNFASCTSAEYMFYRVSSKIIDFSGCKWPLVTNWGNITDYTDGWAETKYFRLGEVYSSFNFRYMVNLTHDNLVEILNDLGTVSTTQTITMGSTNLAKLSAEEIAIATAKGWTVA